MTKTRWTALYLSEEAAMEACLRDGERWIDTVKYGTAISYTSADEALAEAATLDMHGEAVCLTEQHWDERERAWFDAD